MIVFETLCFQNVLLLDQKANLGFKFIRFEERFEKLRFGDGFVWTVGLSVEIKLCLQISSA